MMPLIPRYNAYVDGQPTGPYTWEELTHLEAAGHLQADSHVQREGADEWTTWTQLKALEAGRSIQRAAWKAEAPGATLVEDLRFQTRNRVRLETAYPKARNLINFLVLLPVISAAVSWIVFIVYNGSDDRRDAQIASYWLAVSLFNTASIVGTIMFALLSQAFFDLADCHLRRVKSDESPI